MPLTESHQAARAYATVVQVDALTPLAVVIEQAFLAGYQRAVTDQALGQLSPVPCRPPHHEFSDLRPSESAAREQRAAMDTAVNGYELPPSWRPVLHRSGGAPCHRPAFYITRPVTRGEPPDLSIMRLLPDFHEATPLDAASCGSCGVRIDFYSTHDVDWTVHLVDPPAPARSAAGPLEADEARTESVGLADADASIGLKMAPEETPYPSEGGPPSTGPEQLSFLEGLAPYLSPEPQTAVDSTGASP